MCTMMGTFPPSEKAGHAHNHIHTPPPGSSWHVDEHGLDAHTRNFMFYCHRGGERVQRHEPPLTDPRRDIPKNQMIATADCFPPSCSSKRQRGGHPCHGRRKRSQEHGGVCAGSLSPRTIWLCPGFEACDQRAPRCQGQHRLSLPGCHETLERFLPSGMHTHKDATQTNPGACTQTLWDKEKQTDDISQG